MLREDIHKNIDTTMYFLSFKTEFNLFLTS